MGFQDTFLEYLKGKQGSQTLSLLPSPPPMIMEKGPGLEHIPLYVSFGVVFFAILIVLFIWKKCQPSGSLNNYVVRAREILGSHIHPNIELLGERPLY